MSYLVDIQLKLRLTKINKKKFLLFLNKISYNFYLVF